MLASSAQSGLPRIACACLPARMHQREQQGTALHRMDTHHLWQTAGHMGFVRAVHHLRHPGP